MTTPEAIRRQVAAELGVAEDHLTLTIGVHHLPDEEVKRVCARISAEIGAEPKISDYEDIAVRAHLFNNGNDYGRSSITVYEPMTARKGG